MSKVQLILIFPQPYKFWSIVAIIYQNKMDITVIATKGQVVIPAKLRRKFGVKIGTKI